MIRNRCQCPRDCREHNARLVFMHGAAGSARYFVGRKIRSAPDRYCAWSDCGNLFDFGNSAPVKKFFAPPYDRTAGLVSSQLTALRGELNARQH
jgi:hypothetical protein